MFQNSTTLDILLERFQCTPLGPKLKFLVLSHHFGVLKRPFGFAPHTLRLKLVFRVIHTLSLPYLAHCENQYWVHLMHEFMHPKPFLVLSQRTCPIHYFNLKLMFWVVPWPHLTCCNNLYRGAFNARVYASRTISFFCSKHAQSTNLGLKLQFWVVS